MYICIMSRYVCMYAEMICMRSRYVCMYAELICMHVCSVDMHVCMLKELIPAKMSFSISLCVCVHEHTYISKYTHTLSYTYASLCNSQTSFHGNPKINILIRCHTLMYSCQYIYAFAVERHRISQRNIRNIHTWIERR